MSSTWSYWENNLGIKDVWYHNPKADGNCLFSSIAEGLVPAFETSSDQLRMYAAQQLLQQDDEWFQTVLTFYRDEVTQKQFDGSWSPHKISTKHQLAAEIIKPIHTGQPMDFQGDSIILGLLSKALGVNFIIFEQQKSHGYSQFDNAKNKFTMFILYQNIQNPKSGFSFKHYQVLGVRCENDSIQSIFDSKSIPSNFDVYLKRTDAIGKKHAELEKVQKELEKLKNIEKT